MSSHDGVAVPVLLLVMATLRLAVLIYNGATPVLAGTLWMFVYITAAVVPIAQFHTGLFPMLDSPEYLIPAAILFLVTVVAYEIGRFLGSKTGTRPGQITVRLISIARLKWLTVLSVTAAAYYANSVGGIGVLMSSRRELRESIQMAGLSQPDSQVGSAIVMTAGTVPVFIALVLWIVHLRRSQSRSITGWLWLAVLVAVNLVVNNPLTSPRYWVITMFVTFIFTLPKLSARRFQWTLIAGVLGAIVAFPYLDYFRNAVEYRNPISFISIAEKISTKDFDQFIMTANGMSWIDGRGHTLGAQILGAIFFWVPRSVWPEKARDTGVEVGYSIGASNVNLSSPLPLEFWVDFGWVGAILAFLVVGYFSFRLDTRFSVTRNAVRSQIYVVDILIPLLAGYTFILMRGPLLQSMSRLAVMLAVCLFVMGSRVAVDGLGQVVEKIETCPETHASASNPRAHQATAGAAEKADRASTSERRLTTERHG
ncbi:O-antigen polysaccharide polymerase Wzy [Nesterenkonia muleiensis]|uniref:O-antigen polysaccharide polymerase Wzy n=1 Tax=Nesterenkonia muleiensis TaxID=2282648 RepID=UPI001300985C|nr:O-antigen polysaccharide polymerase Wzy [Nesterenkonia muleiensis]